MTGVLKAKVGGNWVNIIGSGMSAETARWNSAWGIVGNGTVVSGNPLKVTTTETLLTSTINMTMVSGRRYRIAVSARATTSNPSAGVFMQIWLRSGGTHQFSASSITFAPNNIGLYATLFYEWIIDGDGSAKAWSVALTGSAPVDVYSDQQSYFYVEDVGPVIYNATPPTSNPTGIPAFYGRMAVGSVINIPNTPTRFSCVDVIRNNAAMLDTGTGHVVIPKTGWYSAEAHLYANYNGAAPSTWLQIELRVGDVSDHQHNLRREFYVGGIAAVANFTATGVVYYTAGDRIGFWMAQNSGANVTPYSSASTAQSTSIKFAYLGAD